jgi:hypothetical protein
VAGTKNVRTWLAEAVFTVLLFGGVVCGGMAIESVHESHQPGTAVFYWILFILLLGGVGHGGPLPRKQRVLRSKGWLLTGNGVIMTMVTVAVFVYPSLSGPYYDPRWLALASAVLLLAAGLFVLLDGLATLAGESR